MKQSAATDLKCSKVQLFVFSGFIEGSSFFVTVFGAMISNLLKASGSERYCSQWALSARRVSSGLWADYNFKTTMERAIHIINEPKLFKTSYLRTLNFRILNFRKFGLLMVELIILINKFAIERDSCSRDHNIFKQCLQIILSFCKTLVELFPFQKCR